MGAEGDAEVNVNELFDDDDDEDVETSTGPPRKRLRKGDREEEEGVTETPEKKARVGQKEEAIEMPSTEKETNPEKNKKVQDAGSEETALAECDGFKFTLKKDGVVGHALKRTLDQL